MRRLSRTRSPVIGELIDGNHSAEVRHVHERALPRGAARGYSADEDIHRHDGHSGRRARGRRGTAIAANI